MCLILVGIRARPGSRVLLLANRDEFHARASAAAAPWQEDARVLGGRDLVAGGSWLAVHGDGRFAVVTNVRNGTPVPAPRSRGNLVRDYVLGHACARSYLEELLAQLAQFAPFNLIVGDADVVFALDGGSHSIRRLDAGLHVIGNGPLDAAWPKMRYLRKQADASLRADADNDELLHLLRDSTRPPDTELPDTGIGIERERQLSPIFISGDIFGTRAGSLLDIRDDGAIDFTEKSYGPNAEPAGERQWCHAPGSAWQPRPA